MQVEMKLTRALPQEVSKHPAWHRVKHGWLKSDQQSMSLHLTIFAQR